MSNGNMSTGAKIILGLIMCYRSCAHTQRNDRHVMCACMCGKGDIAVTQTNTNKRVP